jgi:hypothetical protein
VKPVPVLAEAALLSVLASVCCRHAATPNILLITLDMTRADRIGAYGYRAAQTPAIDRLAADGILFERAVSAAPITLPAHVSLLTGLYQQRASQQPATSNHLASRAACIQNHRSPV